MSEKYDIDNYLKLVIEYLYKIFYIIANDNKVKYTLYTEK